MARQHGIIKLEGTIGDITFFRTQDGYLARDRGGVSRRRIMTDPAFERNREHLLEFARAARAAELLRLAFDPVLRHIPARHMQGRLTERLLKLIRDDEQHQRGERRLVPERLDGLAGFEFNPKARVSRAARLRYQPAFNRETGALTLSIDPFVPATQVKAPCSARAFQFVALGAALDFEAHDYAAAKTCSEIIPLNYNPTGLIELSCNAGADSIQPLFLVFGIRFYNKTRGNYYPSRETAHHAVRITLVSVS